MLHRVKKLCITILIVILIGIVYAIFWSITGLAIPCWFYEITHLYCPGCGVSRMCLSILQLDFYQAFRYNPGVMIISPILIWYFIRTCVRYIRGQDNSITIYQKILFIIIVILLLLYGVARNTSSFYYLAPTKL